VRAADIPGLVATLETASGDSRRLSCAEALQIAHDLDLSPAVVGHTCDELGIKVMHCQLGCF
jgi:hypothetical protein